MKCADTTVLMNELLDGSLSPGDKAALMEHLQVCPACAADMAAMERLHQLLCLELSRKAVPPPGLHAVIMRSLDNASGRSAGNVVMLPVYLRRLAAAAAVTAVAASAWLAAGNRGWLSHHPVPAPTGITITAQAPIKAKENTPDKTDGRQASTQTAQTTVSTGTTTANNNSKSAPAPTAKLAQAGNSGSGYSSKGSTDHKAAGSASKPAVASSAGSRENTPAVYEQEIAANPGSTELRYKAAEAYWQKGNYAKAVAHYQRAVDLNPSDPMAYRNLATAYNSLDMTNEARDNYNTGIAKTGDPQLMVDLGKIQEKEGELASAVQFYADAAIASTVSYTSY